MTIRSKQLIVVAVAAAVGLLAVLLLAVNHGSSAIARPAARASVSTPKPQRVVRQGHEIRSVAPGNSNSSRAPRHLRSVPRARAAQVVSGFSVLARPQTAAERGDFDIQQLVKDRPTAELDGARALNAAHTVWIVPTTDGQLCIGMKTHDATTTFASACGPASNGLTTGISMTYDGGLLALVPDSARAAQATLKGARSAVAQDVSENYIWLPGGGGVTFTDDSGTHTL